ncbi:alpha/beta hydrolase [Deinococcus aerophilus]|uniref:Alpha/beta hydrolase n=1 Tax=Deinococcus aerophilus TaxID=522488 RepID=A0ABQ2GTW2_9DEIO|nr:alpha/beta hydrolase [Deinococcus aerophilus]GGM10901.1 alpha/beta hydrolase [Deinococcus aerophilus]
MPLVRSAVMSALLLGCVLGSFAVAQLAGSPGPARSSAPLLLSLGAAPDEAALRRVAAVRVVRPGFVVPGTPPGLNASITVRYGPARPRAALLLMPGFLGGAGSFDRLARQIVALDPGVAVWAVDRRSNLLEPQAELAGASPARLAEIVRSGLPVRPPDSVTFMRDWGLDATLRDWRVAVKEARTLTPHVFIGGHSLGAGLAGLYAAYDFGGAPGSNGRGSDDLRGVVMLDGTPDLLGGDAMTRQSYEAGAPGPLGPLTGVKGLAANPYVDALYFGPGLASRGAAQARLAAAQPNAPAPAGGLVPFAATNLAAALLQLEQRYALLPFLTLRTGHATNAVEAPHLLADFLGGKNSVWVAGPQDRRSPVGWQADPQAPTDPGDFVRRFWTPLGDYSEWYFPNRLLLDVAAARQGTRGTPFENDLRVWHTASVPVLGIAAGEGVTTETDYRRSGALIPAPLTVHTLPGAAHLDITAARSDAVARWILAWMRGVTP